MSTNIFSVLGKYLTDTVNGGSPRDNMMYEGFRLLSFHCVNVATSYIRLASAGFFATKNGDETKCYSCGVTHTGWGARENPLLTHRRISPSCSHIAGMTADNIHERPILQPTTSSGSLVALADHGAVGGHSGEGVQNRSAPPSQRQNVSIHHVPTPVAATTSLVSSAKSDCNIPAVATFLPVPTENRGTASTSSTSLHFDGAVYPQYSDFGTRLRSFVSWPVGHCKKPEDLAGVGFFYAGYSDCVRCFVCGVGLRTWEEEDDPWLEHVRWRSSCDYVTTVKGQDFVIQTLAAIGRESRNAAFNNKYESAEDPQRKNVRDIMDADTCRRALEMGFDHRHVRQVALEITSIQGSQSLTLDVLVERLVTEASDQHQNISVPSLGFTHTSSGYYTDSDNGESEEDETGLTNVSMAPTVGDQAGQKHVNWFQHVAAECPGEKCSMDTNEIIHKSLPPTVASGSWDNTGRGSRSLPSYSQNIEEENRQLKESSLCKICLDEPANIVFLPCGHLVTCVTCSPALERCPICRKHIRGTVRIHLASMQTGTHKK